MIQKIFSFATLALVSVPFLVSTVNGQTGKGVKNDGAKEWLVRYHLNDPNKTGDIALRLRVQPGAGGRRLTGTLWRYDDRAAGFYVLRTDGGATIPLEGRITKNQEESSRRKREDFVLSGNYTDTAGRTHVYTIKGFHYAGRNKAEANRNDDQLIIRVHDKVEVAAVAGAMGAAAAHDCDEQPPDEDVLIEEPPTSPPTYDAEDP